jgi:phosphatidate cytidylyltransferase
MAGGSGATVPVQAEAAVALRPDLPSPRPTRWPDLRKRVVSAAILLPAAVFCIWQGGLPWAALMALALAGLGWEWVRLVGRDPFAWPGLVVPLAVLGAAGVSLAGGWWLALGLLAVAAAALAWRAGDAAGRWLAFGVPYLGLAGLALLHLRGDVAAGRGQVLFLFLVVWASDIGAYLAGRWLGGPKLAPAISPNKTWSGSAGGLISVMVVGLLAAYAMEGALSSPGLVLLVSAGLGVVSQGGDLFESWIKRRFDVKDSSALIPGHGGLLDRLDGVLAAAPVAALLALAGAPWH